MYVAMLATLSRQTADSFVLAMFGEPVGKTCLSKSRQFKPAGRPLMEKVVVHALPEVFFLLNMCSYKVFGCYKLKITMGGFCFSLNALSVILVMSSFYFFESFIEMLRLCAAGRNF